MNNTYLCFDNPVRWHRFGVNLFIIYETMDAGYFRLVCKRLIFNLFKTGRNSACMVGKRHGYGAGTARVCCFRETGALEPPADAMPGCLCPL